MWAREGQPWPQAAIRWDDRKKHRVCGFDDSTLFVTVMLSLVLTPIIFFNVVIKDDNSWCSGTITLMIFHRVTMIILNSLCWLFRKARNKLYERTQCLMVKPTLWNWLSGSSSILFKYILTTSTCTCPHTVQKGENKILSLLACIALAIIALLKRSGLFPCKSISYIRRSKYSFHPLSSFSSGQKVVAMENT